MDGFRQVWTSDSNSAIETIQGYKLKRAFEFPKSQWTPRIRSSQGPMLHSIQWKPPAIFLITSRPIKPY